MQYKVVENKAYIKTGIELWYYEEFNPLEDHNDLWNIVIPRLPIGYHVDSYKDIYHLFLRLERIKSGPLPDLSRAVVTLIAEIAKEAV